VVAFPTVKDFDSSTLLCSDLWISFSVRILARKLVLFKTGRGGTLPPGKQTTDQLGTS